MLAPKICMASINSHPVHKAKGEHLRLCKSHPAPTPYIEHSLKSHSGFAVFISYDIPFDFCCAFKLVPFRSLAVASVPLHVVSHDVAYGGVQHGRLHVMLANLQNRVQCTCRT